MKGGEERKRVFEREEMEGRRGEEGGEITWGKGNKDDDGYLVLRYLKKEHR